MPEMVTVAREISSLKANLIRTRLEADGIACFVRGETASSVVGLPAYAGASIDVQVQAFDAIRARRILREIETTHLPDESDEWKNVKPNFAVQVVRGIFLGGMVLCVAMWTLGITNNAAAAGIAGALALAAISFFQITASLKLKR